MKVTVVAPFTPKLVPIAPFCKVVRNPAPHPPPSVLCTAVVESPAKKKAGGFDNSRCSKGKAEAAIAKDSERAEEKRILLFKKILEGN